MSFSTLDVRCLVHMNHVKLRQPTGCSLVNVRRPVQKGFGAQPIAPECGIFSSCHFVKHSNEFLWLFDQLCALHPIQFRSGYTVIIVNDCFVSHRIVNYSNPQC